MRKSAKAGRTLTTVLLPVALLFGTTACGVGAAAQQTATSTPSSIPTSSTISATTSTPMPTSSTTTSAQQNCPYPQSGFDCDFQQRFAAAQAYAANRPGTVGIVVRDRQTGAVWRNNYADTLVWTASTIKLAMTVHLFLADRSGAIALSASDRDLIQRMLHSSDDNAADTLWFKYAGQDHMAFNNDFVNYGMTSLQPQKGFSNFYPYWGFQKCTPNDLDRLINYVLTKLPADLRDYIVGQMRSVDPIQQWGVWGAGPAAQPGNKDGWSDEQGGSVMNTVGFVGSGERYTLAVMNSLNGQGGQDDGKITDTQVAKIIFAGRQL